MLRVAVSLVAVGLVGSFQLPAPAGARRVVGVRAEHKLDLTVLDGPLVPLSNYILVEVDKDRDTTRGGLVLSDKAKEKAQSGTVVSCGPGKAHKESAVLMDLGVAAGERVLWGRYDGAKLKYDGKDHTLLKDTDLACAWPAGEISGETVRALKGNILVKISLTRGQSAGGILLGLAAASAISLVGEVMAVGPGAPFKDGTSSPPPVAVGDMIKFRDFDTTELSIDGVEHVVLDAVHVICKWKA
ncbi:chaperonin 10-like protein [Pelagophyceae sp. CCMP2097]|nr:chaperonin 10-like protein [Pelagophyceae sp. CCMP2097]